MVKTDPRRACKILLSLFREGCQQTAPKRLGILNLLETFLRRSAEC